jgi:hypothetical protein
MEKLNRTTVLDALVEPCPTPPALSTTTTRRPDLTNASAIEDPIRSGWH